MVEYHHKVSLYFEKKTYIRNNSGKNESTVKTYLPMFAVLVATHKDKCSFERQKQVSLSMENLKSKFRCIKDFAFVNTQNGDGMDNLQEKITKVSKESFILSKKIPLFYPQLESLLVHSISNKKKVKEKDSLNIVVQENEENIFSEILSLESVMELVQTFSPGKNELQIRQALEFLRDMGTVLYFDDEPLLCDVVILDLE